MVIKRTRLWGRVLGPTEASGGLNNTRILLWLEPVYTVGTYHQSIPAAARAITRTEVGRWDPCVRRKQLVLPKGATGCRRPVCIRHTVGRWDSCVRRKRLDLLPKGATGGEKSCESFSGEDVSHNVGGEILLRCMVVC